MEAELGFALHLSDFTLHWYPSGWLPCLQGQVHVLSMAFKASFFKMGILTFIDKP